MHICKCSSGQHSIMSTGTKYWVNKDFPSERTEGLPFIILHCSEIATANHKPFNYFLSRVQTLYFTSSE